MRSVLAALGALALGLLIMGTVAGAPGGNSMNLVFERTWGTPDGDFVTGLAVGPDGSVYTVGTLPGTTPLIPECPDILDTDTFLLKWSAQGDLLWQRRWSGPGNDEARGVAVDPAGAAYVTGMTTSFGNFDVFLLKFAPDGTLVWQRTWSGDREEGGEAVAVGPDGNVYVSGFTQSFVSRPGAAALLLKFAPDGTLAWQRMWEGAPAAIAEDLAISSDGAIYIAGNAEAQPFVAKFTSGGSLVWDRAFDAGHSATFTGIGAAPDGGVVAVGHWMPRFDLQVLVVRFAANGALVFARDWGEDTHEFATDAAVGADGTAYVVGRMQASTPGSFDDAFILRVLASGRGGEVGTWGGGNNDGAEAIVLGTGGDLYVAGTASLPPYAFGHVSPHTFRVRGTASDAVATLGIPAGTLGVPTGVVSDLNGSLVFAGTIDAALIRVRTA